MTAEADDLRTAIAELIADNVSGESVHEYEEGQIYGADYAASRIVEFLGLPADVSVAAVRQAWERSQAIDAARVNYDTVTLPGARSFVLSSTSLLASLRALGGPVVPVQPERKPT